MRHAKTTLREVNETRTVGFADAVRDIGTHSVKGREEYYSPQQVREVLAGRHKSARLLRRIADKRPDLFALRYVAPEVKAWFVKEG